MSIRIIYILIVFCVLFTLTQSFSLSVSKISKLSNVSKKSLSKSYRIIPTLRFMSPLNAFTNGLKYFDSDKESNRKFRRTVFNKHDWRRHRSGNRYFSELLSMPRSVVLRGLTMQALSVTIFSGLLVLYNFLIEIRILPKFLPLFTSPPLPFNLTSSALGLLLVFRTNAAYSRWKDARIAWAVISAKSFDVMRQSIGWIDEDVCSSTTVSSNTTKEQKIEHANFIKSKICRYIVAYAKSLKWQLGHQGNDRRLIEDLNGILDHKEMESLIAARHRPQHILAQTTHFLKASGLAPNVQTHIDRSICDITVSMTTCERIFTTPIPLMYTRHTARFLLLWLLAMPMCLYHEYPLHQKWMVPIISFLQAIFLFGIEELGVQIEEPFSILPLANICSDIHRSGEDLLYDAGIPWFGCSDEGQVVVEEEKLQSQIHRPLPPAVVAAVSSQRSTVQSQTLVTKQANSLPEYLYASQGYFNTTSTPVMTTESVSGMVSNSNSGELGSSTELPFRIPID